MFAFGRTPKIQAMAQRLGFSFLGDAVPSSLPLTGTRMEGLTKAHNIISGVSKGIPVIAFDAQVGKGRDSWRRTVLAAQCAHNPFAAVTFDRDLAVERSGEWIFLYRAQEPSALNPFMPPSELEAHIESVG